MRREGVEMVVFLMSVGVLLTMLGVSTVLYGVPYNAFEVGKTLILSGVVTTVGGLLSIGLAVVAREIVKLSALIASRPAVAAEARFEDFAPDAPSIVVDPAPASSATVAVERLRATQPPMPLPVDEPVAPPAPPLRAPPPPPPLRRGIEADTGITAPRAPMAAPAGEEREAPRVRLPDPSRAPSTAGEGVRRDAAEPRPDGPRLDSADEPLATSRPGWEQDPLGPGPDDAAPTPERKRFFAWTKRRQTVSSDAEAPHAEESAPLPEQPSPLPMPPLGRAATGESGDTAAPRLPLRPRPPLPAAPAPAPASAALTAPEASAAEPSPSQPAAPTVLKSGVIDGMGYTLYTDGSIDAEFPDGTLRFASIEELRHHLEHNAG